MNWPVLIDITGGKQEMSVIAPRDGREGKKRPPGESQSSQHYLISTLVPQE